MFRTQAQRQSGHPETGIAEAVAMRRRLAHMTIE